MRRLILAMTLSIGTLASAGHAAAQATTYTFTGGLYEAFVPPTNCVVGECATFTAAQRPTITLTFASPLAPNLPLGDLSTGVIAYSFSDGIRSANGPGPNTAIFRVSIATDGAGLPSTYAVALERTPGPPYLTGDPGDPNSRISLVQIQDAQSIVQANLICQSRGPGPAAVVSPGTCPTASSDAGSSQAASAQPSVVAAAPAAVPAVVPTMSEWALILLGLVLAGAAATWVQRRRLSV